MTEPTPEEEATLKELFRFAKRIARQECEWEFLASEIAEEAVHDYACYVMGGGLVDHPRAWIKKVIKNKLKRHLRMALQDRITPDMAQARDDSRIVKRRVRAIWMREHESNICLALTRRQCEVFRIMSHAGSISETARILCLDRRTIQEHLARIGGRIQRAVDAGLIPPPPPQRERLSA